MTERDSGRPPPEVFYTVQDREQARLLSDPDSYKYFKPFIARERTASAAAQEIGCNLDTMLYRMRRFLQVGLLEVTRLEKRAGRPIKHYRSVADAFFIPFDAKPFADLEEQIRSGYQAQQEVTVRAVARFLRYIGKEGTRIYRRSDTGEVWRQSAAAGEKGVNIFNFEDLRAYLTNYQGLVGEFLMEELALTDDEAKQLLLELYRLWSHYRDRPAGGARRTFHFQFTLVLEPE